MKEVGRYDGNLQMFVQEARTVDIARLGFIRWLAEHGKLEHAPEGPAIGEYSGNGSAEPKDELELLMAR